jgi:isocitrate dehydrogenase
LAERLIRDAPRIVFELGKVQGSPTDLGGYYLPDPERAAAVMRPSQTFNEALRDFGG